jgi:carboxylesterase type B
LFTFLEVGHSAGAACVHAHVVSPRSRGLFRNVAALSGSAVNIWASRYIFHKEVAHKQAEVRRSKLIGLRMSLKLGYFIL